MNHRRLQNGLDDQNRIEAADHRALGQMYRAYPSEAVKLLEIFFGDQRQTRQYRRR
jgi:hypothetical protein